MGTKDSGRDLPHSNMSYLNVGVGIARLDDKYSIMLSTPFGPMFLSPGDVEELMDKFETQLQIIEMLITQEARVCRAEARRGSLFGPAERELESAREELRRAAELQSAVRPVQQSGVSEKAPDAEAPEPPGVQPDRGEGDPPGGWDDTLP